MIGMEGDRVVMKGDKVCVGCCCFCADDCTGTLNYNIEWPPDVGAEGDFAITDSPHAFNATGSNGAYLTGTISVACENCVWTVTVEVCYGDNDTPNTSEIWEAELQSGPDGCPPAGEVPVSNVDGLPSDLVMTITLT